MLTISKPLSAAQARTYHAEEFSNVCDNYYTIGDRIVGQWHGQLAEEWGLRGEVGGEHFQRLADGRHPLTNEPLVRHQTACQYTNARGEHVKTMAHRAGWDATFSAPKSVSLTALVGGDERVRQAHRASVAVALDETERYVQARLGGNLPAETTGRWVAAINQVIHRAMQREGHVDHAEHRTRVLVARQEITGADRQWAERYDRGDVVRYSKGSKTLGIAAGAYARVERVNAKENLVTVNRADGHRLTYDPRRLQGVTLYRETDRAFARGDRVQFTTPDRERHVANRELGTVEQIDKRGHLRLRLDSGRAVAFALRDHPHLDYGYAVTSHSSQGQTADRVLVHVDTKSAADRLLNRRLAYVALSRGRYDAKIYTNDKTHLAETLSRDVAHRSAMEPSLGPESSAKQIEVSVSRNHVAQQTQGLAP